MPFEILAHRCGPAVRPGNSIAGMVAAAKAGATWIECDVTFARDGYPVIWDVAETEFCARRVNVAKLSFEEARQLSRVDGEGRLVTIDEVWDFLRQYPDCKLMFDVKYYRYDIEGILRLIPIDHINWSLERIVNPAKRLKLSPRLGFIVFFGGLPLLWAVKRVAPSVEIGLMTVWPWQRIARYLDLVRLDSLTFGWKGLNHWRFFPSKRCELIQEARAHGLKVYAGLANSVSDIAWVKEGGFDGAWTDNVPLARAVLAAGGLSVA